MCFTQLLPQMQLRPKHDSSNLKIKLMYGRANQVVIMSANMEHAVRLREHSAITGHSVLNEK